MAVSKFSEILFRSVAQMATLYGFYCSRALSAIQTVILVAHVKKIP